MEIVPMSMHSLGGLNAAKWINRQVRIPLRNTNTSGRYAKKGICNYGTLYSINERGQCEIKPSNHGGKIEILHIDDLKPDWSNNPDLKDEADGRNIPIENDSDNPEQLGFCIIDTRYKQCIALDPDKSISGRLTWSDDYEQVKIWGERSKAKGQKSSIICGPLLGLRDPKSIKVMAVQQASDCYVEWAANKKEGNGKMNDDETALDFLQKYEGKTLWFVVDPEGQRVLGPKSSKTSQKALGDTWERAHPYQGEGMAERASRTYQKRAGVTDELTVVSVRGLRDQIRQWLGHPSGTHEGKETPAPVTQLDMSSLTEMDPEKLELVLEATKELRAMEAERDIKKQEWSAMQSKVDTQRNDLADLVRS